MSRNELRPIEPEGRTSLEQEDLVIALSPVDEQPVGYGLTVLESRIGTIDEVAVLPSARRGGVGSPSAAWGADRVRSYASGSGSSSGGYKRYPDFFRCGSWS
jgi:hypothetical protein